MDTLNLFISGLLIRRREIDCDVWVEESKLITIFQHTALALKKIGFEELALPNWPRGILVNVRIAERLPLLDGNESMEFHCSVLK
jgi:hypothetical protein